MKVSEFLRHYQIAGTLPEGDCDLTAFWAGWLIGKAASGHAGEKMEDALSMSIHAAEFIESRARE